MCQLYKLRFTKDVPLFRFNIHIIWFLGINALNILTVLYFIFEFINTLGYTNKIYTFLLQHYTIIKIPNQYDFKYFVINCHKKKIKKKYTEVVVKYFKIMDLMYLTVNITNIFKCAI